MKQWEYKFIDSSSAKSSGAFNLFKNESDVEVYLNMLGNDGWEIINISSLSLDTKYNFIGIAKREVKM